MKNLKKAAVYVNDKCYIYFYQLHRYGLTFSSYISVICVQTIVGSRSGSERNQPEYPMRTAVWKCQAVHIVRLGRRIKGFGNFKYVNNKTNIISQIQA